MSVQTNVYVFVNTWGCYCVVVVYVGTHTHISFDLGDLGWVVCCSARDEARTHIHKDRFVLVKN